jgi:hypothetical protein
MEVGVALTLSTKGLPTIQKPAGDSCDSETDCEE